MMLAIVSFFLFGSIAEAQRVDKLTVTTFTNPPATKKGGGGFTSITTLGATYLGGNGVYYPYDIYPYYYTLAMPFAFKYDDYAYSAGQTLYVQIGSVSFTDYQSTGFPYYYPVTYPNNITGQQASVYPTSIAPLSGLQTSGGVYYLVSGNAPTRALTVEWYQSGDYPSRSLGVVSYQVKLYETSNAIEFIYEQYGFSITNSGYQSYYKSIGLNGRASPSFVQNLISQSTYSTPNSNYRFTGKPNAQLTSSPKQINFGSQITGNFVTANITVGNAGDDLTGVSKVAIGNVTLTGDPDYSIVSMPTPSDSMLVGQTRTIVVKFAPTTDGLRTAGITINSNGNDSGTQTIALTGIGLAPLISVDTNVLFKNKFVKMGQSMVSRIIINSTNVPTLNINSFQFVGVDAGEFSIAQGPSSMSIPGGKSDSIFIRYTPTKEGRHIATLNIVNNSINNPTLPITLWGTGTLPHIVVTPSIMKFDSVSIGTEVCKNIRIFNPGTDTLLIKSNTIVSNDGDFAYTALIGADSIIPPDKFKEVMVCFKPISKGSRVARLRLTTNIIKTFEQPSRDTAGQFLIDIRGTGVPVGLMSQKIGDIEGGGWVDQSIIGKEICINDTIWNNGGADIQVKSMVLGGSAAANYTITGQKAPFSIKANGYTVIRICCTPTTQGPNPATLTISGTSSEKAISSVATLSIKGLMVCATATPNPLFDGHLVLENTDSAICVDVTNCGDVPTDYTASLPSGTDYTISGTNPSGVIAPGAKATFCIHFNPKTMGEAKTTLTITPSTSELAPLAIPVGGVGACAEPTAAPLTVNPMGKGGHGPFTISVKNNGNFDWTPGNATITPNDGVFMLDGPVPAIAAGATQTVTGTFNPTDNNKTYSASITFPQAAPSQCAALTLTLTGQSDATSVGTKTEEAGFSLGQNYPNPFASVTTFSFTTPTEAQIVLSISDLTGRQIKVITSGNVSSGDHTVQFDASTLANGSYIIALESNNIRLARQIVVAR